LDFDVKHLKSEIYAIQSGLDTLSLVILRASMRRPSRTILTDIEEARRFAENENVVAKMLKVRALYVTRS